jgi:hypothetical protein
VAIARLRGLAAEILRADGHAAAEGTLTRTSTTLQALAAAGSFAPDPPGRLLADRDPPGFESMAGAALGASHARLDRNTSREAQEPGELGPGVRAHSPALERAAKERSAAERARALERQRALERERAMAECENLERLAEQARRDERARSKTTEELRAALQRAETALADARSRARTSDRLAADARARLDELTREPKPSS